MATLKANGGAVIKMEKTLDEPGKTTRTVVARCANNKTLVKTTITYWPDGRKLEYGWTVSGVVAVQMLLTSEFQSVLESKGWTVTR